MGSKGSKVIASIILISQIVCMLPAQTMMVEKNYSKLRLEQYLRRAESETKVEDWERIAKECVMQAMKEWESSNTYLRENNYEKYIETRNEVLEEYELIKDSEYVKWYINSRIEEENNKKISEIAQSLVEKRLEYKEKNSEIGENPEEVEKEWEENAEEIVTKYMNEIVSKNKKLYPELSEELRNFTEEQIAEIYETVSKDYEGKVYREYKKIYASETNQLKAELLYDTKSTKKISASQAAEEIAKETAQAVKNETDKAMNELFTEFQTTINEVEESEIEIERTNWLKDFEKVLEESIEKWNEAERKFLAERSEWELNASEVYEENEEAWSKGYKILQEKRNAWFEEIEAKLIEGRKEWDKSEQELNSQLEIAYKELEATIKKERDSKEKMINLQVSIYNQSRQMLNIVSSALEGVAETFGEFYYGKYAYWKTETQEKDIDKLFLIVEKFKKTNKSGEFFNNDESIDEAITLIQKLIPLCNDANLKRDLESLINKDGTEGWLKYLKEYKEKALNAKEELYKLTGCIYSDEAENPAEEIIYFNELDYEIIKAQVSLEYWTEEYEVAKAVQDYAQSIDSGTETDEQTKENLQKTTAAYEIALKEYEEAVEELAEERNIVELSEKEVEEKYNQVNESRTKLEAIKDEYSELMVVYLGAKASPIREKINSLIVEYDTKKKQTDEEEFIAYYEALVEYTSESQKQKYLSAKNTIENGTESGDLSREKVEKYKEEVNVYKNNLDLESSSTMTQIRDYITKVELYCGENAYKLKKYLEEYKNRSSNQTNETTAVFTEAEKKQYRNIIIKYLTAIEEYWTKELTKKTEAIYYIENGKFKEESKEYTEEEQREIEIKNYLEAVLNAKVEWEETLQEELNEYKEIMLKVEEISRKTGEELLSTVKKAIEDDGELRKLLQGQNIFNNEIMQEWIKVEYQRLNAEDFEKAQMQKEIKDLYSPYVLKQNTSHAKALEEINSVINNEEIKNLTEENLYLFIERLREYETELNIYGQSALENYISSIIDYVATKTVSEESLELSNYESQKESTILEIEKATEEINKTMLLLNYGITDLKTILGTMITKETGEREKFYEEARAEVEEYVSYLIMVNLYSTDLERCKDKEELKAFFKSNLEEMDENQKESSWESVFNKLEEEVKDRICQKILEIYYFDKEAEEYKEYVKAIDEYISLIGKAEAMHLALDFEGLSDALSQIVKANNFVNEYFSIQQSIGLIESQIKAKEEEISIVENDEKLNGEEKEGIIENLENEKIQLEEQKREIETYFEEFLLKDREENNWYEKIKEYDQTDAMWLIMYLAGEEQFFVYMQACGDEQYEQLKDKLNESHRTYVDNKKKINDLVGKYCALVDGDIETWVNELTVELTDEEKKKIIGILKGLDINSNYYTYEADRENILSSTGAGHLVYNRITEMSDRLTEYVISIYNKQDKELKTAQSKYNFINSQINALNSDEISWIEITKENGITSDTSMDEATKNALDNWLSNENEYEKILEEKLKESNKHLTWLKEESLDAGNSFIDLTTGVGQINQYLENMNKAYMEYISVHDCSSIVGDIISANNSYRIANQEQSKIAEQIKEVQERIKDAEQELKTNQEEWKKRVNILVEETNKYNTKVENADNLFVLLKKAEKAKRIEQEKYDYATSIYLKNLGEVAEEEYVSPQEKEVIIKYSLDKAQVRVDVLNAIKNEKYEEPEDYTTAMKAYQEAAKKYYEVIMIKSETDKSLAIQEELVREKDAALQAEYSKITNTQEIEKVETESNTVKYVYLEKNAAGSYTVRLLKAGEKNNDEILKEYFVEKNVEEQIVGWKRKISQAMQDAREWVFEVSKKDDKYLKNLMLAAIHIKKNIDDYDLNTDELPKGECQGINFKELINKYKNQVVEEAYNSIISMEGGEEDLAKYLMYNYEEENKNGVIREVFTNSYVESSLRSKVYERAKKDVDGRYGGLIAESIAFGVFAAYYGAIAAACLFPAFLVPLAIAVGFTAASITAAVKADKLYNDVSKHADNAIRVVGETFKKAKNKINGKLELIRDAREVLETELKTLNFMYSGTTDENVKGVEINEKNVKAVLKERAKYLSCNYDDIIDSLYTEKALEDSGAKTEKTISDAINKVNDWYAREESKAKTELDAVIVELKQSQRENISLYELKINKNAELSQEAKEKLHELSLKVSDTTLNAEGKEAAKKVFEEYETELSTSGIEEYRAELERLARASFGTGSWSTEVYMKDMYKFYSELYPENIDYTGVTENYTSKTMQDFKAIVLAQFDKASEVQLNKLLEEQNKERKQLATKKENWEEQMSVLLKIAEVEWKKAEEILLSGYNTWKKIFDTEYTEKYNQWNENYEKFLEAKQEWVNEQYLYAVNVGNSKLIDQSGLDVESTIAAVLAETQISKLNYEAINAEEYTEKLIGESGLKELMNSVESLQNRGKGAVVSKKHGSKINTSLIETIQRAEETMLAIEEDIKEGAAKLAAEHANRIVEQTIAASMERIEAENEGMREWEETLVRNNGYTVEGKNITRETIVDSTIWETYYETHTVAYYEDFTTAKPSLKVNLASTMLDGLTSGGIMQLVAQANDEIEQWNIEIFGDTEEDEDGNIVQKQWTIPRSSSKTIHASESSEVRTKYEELMADENNQKDKARYEELLDEEYDKLSDEEKEELNELSRKLITVRDGKLGEWIGYAPLFKSGKKDDELDLKKDRESNVVDYGLGQMGKIMLDFQWNSMKANQGWEKLALPAYDQPLWKSNGSFEAPTIRGISSIVFEVVGTATGQKWFSYADDLIFAAIDAGGGFKSVEEVGLELAKTAISAAVGVGMGAASNALGDLVGNALAGAGKFVNFAAQAGISMTTSYATSVTNSAINSFYIGEEGLAFNTDGFVESLYSAETISGAIGAGVTAGLGGINLRDGNNITLNSNTFNVGGIKALNGLAGGLVQNGVSLAMGGNANFNLLSFKGVGMLEFSFGKDGIKSKIGMGGTNISYQNLKAAASGYKEASKVTDWKYGNEQSSSTLNSINMLGYTNSGMNIQLSKDIWSEKLAVEYGDTGNDYGNYTIGERKIVLSENLLGGGRAGSAKLASVMSHEGTHYYGNRVEAIAHMSAAETYAQLNQKFKLQADTSFSMEMLAGIMNTDNWKENTGDVDHWKMTWGGQLVSDGSGWLKDENGMYISKDGTRTPEPIPGETLGAEKQESGLLNIMNGESAQLYNTFSDEQKQQAQAIMESAGLEMDKTGQWNNALGKKVDMTDVMTVAGEKIANPIFETYYNNKVDYDLATAYGLDLRFSETAMNKTVPEVLQAKYSGLVTQHMQETDSPAALVNKYTWSIYDKDGIATQLFKIDENNSFLDDLVKQTDPGLNSVINKYGCNFMSTIAYPQLLTGNVLSAAEIQSIWTESTNTKISWWKTGEFLPYVDFSDSYVRQPDYVANLVAQRQNYSKLSFQFGGSSPNSAIGYKVKVPYSTTGHWLMSDPYFKYLYNPANTTGKIDDFNAVYVRNK